MVNILNEGNFVPGIPTDYEVEVPALVSKKGVQGIRTEGLPRHLMAYLYRDRIAPVEMELAAFEKGDKNFLLSLIMMDPSNKSEAQAKAFLEEILALPYHTEMKEYYK